MTRPHKGEKHETNLFCSAKIPRSSLLFLVCTCPLSIYVRYGNDPTKLFYAVSTDFVFKKLVLGKFCGSMECESFQSVFCQQSPDCGNCDCDYHVCFISWAYAFARMQFPGRDILFYLYLFSMMVPTVTNLIPQFLLMKDLHLVDSYLGLLLIYIGIGVPSNTFFLRNFFLSLPKELEEAVIN